MNKSELLNQVKRKAIEYCKRLGISESVLPLFGVNGDDAVSVYITQSGYRLEYSERGRRDLIIETEELDTLLYYIFRYITSDMAGAYELNNRDPTKDSRRIRFAKQIELLTILSSDWAERERQDHSGILANHPFDDERTVLVDELVKKISEICGLLRSLAAEFDSVGSHETASFFKQCASDISNGVNDEQDVALSKLVGCASLAQHGGFNPDQEKQLHQIGDCAKSTLDLTKLLN